jgi:hypothetical protein
VLSLKKSNHLTNILKEHNQIQENERFAYKQRSLEGHQNSSIILSIIMDSMRMKMILHVLSFPKSLSSLNPLAVSIFGILNHSDDSQHFYLHHQYWSGGANHILSLLFSYIYSYFKKGNRPTTLIIQADNSWKESKNRIIFATLSWFVHLGLFKRIEMHCLIQGHTHEDIDQTFSSIARAFWITTILSIEDFQSLIQKIFKRKTETPTFNQVWDFAKYFQGNY